jgi:hypothetical protein
MFLFATLSREAVQETKPPVRWVSGYLRVLSAAAKQSQGNADHSASSRTPKPVFTIVLHHHRWQNSPFWAIAFLRRFCQIWPIPAMCHELEHAVFTYLDFATIYMLLFFGGGGESRSSALRPAPNLEEHHNPYVYRIPTFAVMPLHMLAIRSCNSYEWEQKISPINDSGN